VRGLALATVGVVWLRFGRSNVARAGGFGHPEELVPGAVGLALCGAYVVHALRRGSGALIDLALLRHRPLAMATLVSFMAGLAMYGAMFILPLFYQVLRGSDALATGLLLIPQGVGALASRGTAGRLTDSIGARWVVVGGFAVMTAGTVPFALADASTSAWWLGVVLVVRGLGLGAVFMPLMASAYVGLAHAEIPHASIVTRVAQQVGGSFGIAVIAVILQQQTAAATSAEQAADAFGTTFWCAVGLMAVGLASAMLLPGREMTEEPQTMPSTASTAMTAIDTTVESVSTEPTKAELRR
jgi:MFS family permease